MRAVGAVRSVLLGSVCAIIPVISAHAFIVSDELEAVVYSSVGAAWQSVTFENSFTNPIPVCTYNLPSSAAQPATVRIRNVSATGMQIKIQQFPNSTTVTPGDVHCIIAEAGTHTLGTQTFFAGTALTTATHGRNATNRWNQNSMVEVTSSVGTGLTNPATFGQVITANDADASVFFASNCVNRNRAAFENAARICVGKHIGSISGSIANETVGYIVFEQGTSTLDDVQFQVLRGGDSVEGVGNSPPYSYATNATYEVAIATMAGEDGGDGGWAVLYGANPLAGSQIDLAVDEEDAAGDTTRTHANEPLFFWALRRVPDFDLSKTVDLGSIAEAQLLSYEIVLDNTGQLDLTGVSITDVLPNGTAGSLSGPVESFASGTAGVLEPGETWTYTVSYTPSAAEVTAGGPLINNVTATTAEYGSFAKADETASAQTIIIPAAPDLDLVKTATFTTGNPPASVNDVILYTYDVTNTGNVTIANVNVGDVHNGLGDAPDVRGEALLTDASPPGDSTDATPNDGIWDTLKPGDTVRFSWSYTVTQNDMDLLQ